MNKILIALDYSPAAQQVAELSFNLFNSNNVEITLLHVVENPVYYSSNVFEPIMGFGGYVDTDFLAPQLNENLKKESYSYLDKTRQHLGNFSIKTLVTEGDAATSIIETAKDLKMDVVVVGSHHKQWLEKIFTGSVAEKILLENDFAVLVIPTKENQSGI